MRACVRIQPDALAARRQEARRGSTARWSLRLFGNEQRRQQGKRGQKHGWQHHHWVFESRRRGRREMMTAKMRCVVAVSRFAIFRVAMRHGVVRDSMGMTIRRQNISMLPLVTMHAAGERRQRCCDAVNRQHQQHQQQQPMSKPRKHVRQSIERSMVKQ